MRTKELEALAHWIQAQIPATDRGAARLGQAVDQHLQAVRTTAAGTGTKRSWWQRCKAAATGSDVERVHGNLDAAEADLMRLASRDVVASQLPSLEAHINRFLPSADPRRVQVHGIARKVVETGTLAEVDRGTVIAAHHAASSQRRREMLRVRSFRNIVLFGALALVPVVLALAVVGWRAPSALPLCFYPEEQQRIVCPVHAVPDKMPGAPPAGADLDPYVDKAVARGDIALVEAVGVLAAAVAMALTVRRVKGTSTPYNLPLALALLKLPLGALTAVIGLVLMSAGFVPGLTALDTSAQILGWAAVFGYAQHLLTRLIDQRADALLGAVGGRGAAGDRDTGAGPVAAA